jgi:hypothetical protein
MCVYFCVTVSKVENNNDRIICDPLVCLTCSVTAFPDGYIFNTFHTDQSTWILNSFFAFWFVLHIPW